MSYCRATLKLLLVVVEWLESDSCVLFSSRRELVNPGAHVVLHTSDVSIQQFHCPWIHRIPDENNHWNKTLRGLPLLQRTALQVSGKRSMRSLKTASTIPWMYIAWRIRRRDASSLDCSKELNSLHRHSMLVERFMVVVSF